MADLPVLEIVSAIYIRADLTLGLGKVVHDYLQQPVRRPLRSYEEKPGHMMDDRDWLREPGSTPASSRKTVTDQQGKAKWIF